MPFRIQLDAFNSKRRAINYSTIISALQAESSRSSNGGSIRYPDTIICHRNTVIAEYLYLQVLLITPKIVFITIEQPKLIRNIRV